MTFFANKSCYRGCSCNQSYTVVDGELSSKHIKEDKIAAVGNEGRLLVAGGPNLVSTLASIGYCCMEVHLSCLVGRRAVCPELGKVFKCVVSVGQFPDPMYHHTNSSHPEQKQQSPQQFTHQRVSQQTVFPCTCKRQCTCIISVSDRYRSAFPAHQPAHLIMRVYRSPIRSGARRGMSSFVAAFQGSREGF